VIAVGRVTNVKEFGISRRRDSQSDGRLSVRCGRAICDRSGAAGIAAAVNGRETCVYQ
jgi:hypothetical protein